MHGLNARRRAWLRAAAAHGAIGACGLPAWAQGLAPGTPAPGASSPAAPTPTGAARQRIVSVGGAITETLYALGAQADLVGADTTSLFPDAARALPSVGYARTLSAEGVLSLRPTLLLVTPEAGPPAVLQQLAAAGLALHVLDADHRIEGVLARTERVAALCGRAAAGATLAAQLQQAWTQSRSGVAAVAKAGLPKPRVLFVLAHSLSQVRVAGSGTAADAMIGHAGAVNALQGVQGYKPLTPEAAVAAAPDVILATDQGLQAAGGIDGLLRSPGLAATPAGRARRVVSMEALFLLGFGPRLPQAVAALAAGLHGARA